MTTTLDKIKERENVIEDYFNMKIRHKADNDRERNVLGEALKLYANALQEKRNELRDNRLDTTWIDEDFFEEISSKPTEGENQ